VLCFILNLNFTSRCDKLFCLQQILKRKIHKTLPKFAMDTCA